MLLDAERLDSALLMFKNIVNIINLLPKQFWFILAGFLGVSSATTPIAIAYLIVNSGSIEYKTGETEINLKGKRLTNVNEEKTKKLEQQLERQNQIIQELAEAAKNKKVDGKLKPQIEKLEESAVESKIRLEDVADSNEELNNFVEEAIAEE
ncbi:MAG: hypothetical protein QNJ72_18620 [Pleurocapsa sp. MO_226.B13]|nr:hypothetical protein [Pleurocapsa sp. MO_226.B13]